MTPKKEKYLKNVIKGFEKEYTRKFRRGDKSHGDDFFKLTAQELVEEAIQENLDQYSYLTRLRDLLK